jgi:hypothetical protein
VAARGCGRLSVGGASQPGHELVEAGEAAEQPAGVDDSDSGEGVRVGRCGRGQVGQGGGEGLVEAQTSRHPDGLDCRRSTGCWLSCSRDQRREVGEFRTARLDVHLVLTVGMVDRHRERAFGWTTTSP